LSNAGLTCDGFQSGDDPTSRALLPVAGPDGGHLSAAEELSAPSCRKKNVRSESPGSG
jgi:hypothetical protein